MPETGGEPMSYASLKVVPEDMRTSIIYIHSYADKNPKGTFYNLYYGEEIAFGNLTRLLLLMEDLMDEMDCPQASVHSRHFGKMSKGLERASIERLLPKPEQEVIATFTVKVLFRQGASWQGKISWAEGKEEVSFRSVLELVKLMDSALPQPEICEQEAVGEAEDAG